MLLHAHLDEMEMAQVCSLEVRDKCEDTATEQRRWKLYVGEGVMKL